MPANDNMAKASTTSEISIIAITREVVENISRRQSHLSQYSTSKQCV